MSILNFRFVVDENINNTGISFFAVFDGHGGEFAADYAKDYLVPNLYNKIIETSNVLRGKGATDDVDSKYRLNSNKQECFDDNNKENIQNNADDKATQSSLVQRRSSFKKSYSTAEDCGPKGNCNRDSDVFMDKLNSIIRPKDHFNNNNNNNNSNDKPQTYAGKCYIENGKINFGKMLTDEVLAADYKLVEAAKKTVRHLLFKNFN